MDFHYINNLLLLIVKTSELVNFCLNCTEVARYNEIQTNPLRGNTFNFISLIITHDVIEGNFGWKHCEFMFMCTPYTLYRTACHRVFTSFYFQISRREV